MNIPHQAPLKFAQEVVTVNETKAQVKCVFPFVPTLAMLFEAAAQSSSAFSQEESKMGFIVSVKDAELMDDTPPLEVIIDLDNKAVFGNVYEMGFIVFDINHTKEFAQGTLTLVINDGQKE